MLGWCFLARSGGSGTTNKAAVQSAVAAIIVTLTVVGVFMALDKTVLHVYVPEDSNNEPTSDLVQTDPSRTAAEIDLAVEEQEVLFNFNQTFKVGVTSEPLNTQIIVDGIPQNRNTPTQISLPPGQHTIAVQLEGYVMEGAAHKITLESDIMDPLRFKMRKEQ